MSRYLFTRLSMLAAVALFAACDAPRMADTGPDTGCARSQLSVAVSGGGPAAGQMSVVLRFRNHGAACRVEGWPRMVALNAGTQMAVSRHLVNAPAVVDGRIEGPVSVTLRTGDAAYLVVAGADVSASGACPQPYRRFKIWLPGMATAFELAARIPNGGGDFPACVPLGVSPVLPARDIVSTLR